MADDGHEHSDQVVTPWDVQGGSDGAIDYDKLIKEFGVSAINQALIDRVEKLTGRPAHPFLKRGVFFAHRDLHDILNAYEKGEPFYLYTGRGPSSDALHLGHLVPFMFTKWLQDVFKVPLVIQLTDDEKFLWKGIELEEVRRLAIENAKDIIACGFDPKLTFIFRDSDYKGTMWPTIKKIRKRVPFNQVKGIFGLTQDDCTGKIVFPAVQAAPSFPDSFPKMFGGRRDVRCLIPCAIDQDPYFRMTRDVAQKIGHKKPALIESRFFPALQGETGKMSASDTNSAIFVTDTPMEVEDKIRQYACSGVAATVEEHRAKGCNLDTDVPWKYLNFFLDDEERLEKIARECMAGNMMADEVKAEIIQVLQKLVAEHQRRRSAVTEEVVMNFMTPRDQQLPGREAPRKKSKGKAAAIDQVATPWDAKEGSDGPVDYENIIQQSGASAINDDLIRRIEEVTGCPAHPLLKRGMFCAHRDLQEVLQAYKEGEPFYLHIGRGSPSKALHLGHLVPLMFTKWLQEAFKVPLVIQLLEDETDATPAELKRLTTESVKDILACGFDRELTFIFQESDYVDTMNRTMEDLSRHIRGKDTLRLTPSDCIEKYALPATAAAPCFAASFPQVLGGRKDVRCLVVSAIDQDPFFQMIRDTAPKLGHTGPALPPALIECRPLPPLEGDTVEIGASETWTPVLMSDTSKQITKKVNRHAFSGGGATLEEHQAKGANLAVDMPWRYLRVFCDDDEQLSQIEVAYGSGHTLTADGRGRMLTGEIKAAIIKVLQQVVAEYQERRQALTDEVVKQFMTPRPLL